jgi:hypothetical protein
MVDDLGLLTRVATFGLVDRGPLIPAPLEDPIWEALVGYATFQRTEGLLAASVGAGGLPVTDRQMIRTREVARSRASLDLDLERETVRTAKIFDQANVPFRMLKGPAWAHSVYPDPMWRGFGDVDVLVESSRWYRAVEALETSGGRRLFPELRPGFDGRFGKDATFIMASGLEIDLHRTLVVGPYGLWIDGREIFSRAPTRLDLGGYPVTTLDPQAAFLHACYNAALGDDPPRLAALRDVAQMAMSEGAAPEETFSLARRWRAVNVVRRAIDLAAGGLDLPLRQTGLGIRFAGEVGRRDRILLSTYRGRGRGYTSQLAGTIAVPGLRAKAAYLFALALPQRSYLRARGYSLISFMRHAIQRVRQWR